MLSSLSPRPRTADRFIALMDLYERNYMLVRLLAPALRSMSPGNHVSNAPESMPLELGELCHERYTSTFRLTYRLSRRTSRDDRPAREPNLAIRLYHDARTCEVMSGLLPGQTLEARRTRDLDEGHRLNAFLNRWLAYCLRQGHGFEGALLAPARRRRALGDPASEPDARRGVGREAAGGADRSAVNGEE